MTRLFALTLAGLLCMGVALADEAPISGTIKAVDRSANTLTIARVVRGRASDVVVHLGPSSKIVRFARASAPGIAGFVEQAAELTDLKPGWVVSVTTKHEGGLEVAEVVKVVFER